MTAIDRTAYPRFKESYSAPELHTLFIPTPDEMTLVNKAANSDAQKLTLLVLLKCCQSLGYIPRMETIPEQMVQHIRAYLGLQSDVSLTFARANLVRCRRIIRTYLDIRRYSQGGREFIETAVTKAAQTMSDPADLINLAIELLIQQRYQLPAFSSLDRLVGHIREQVHQQLYQQINARLSDKQRKQLDELLRVPTGDHRTPFNRMKAFPKKATLTQVRKWAARLSWTGDITDVETYQ